MLPTKNIALPCTIGLLAALLLAACRPVQTAPARQVDSPLTPPGQTTLYVGPTVVACSGVAPQLCLQVKEDPAAEYSNFYDRIEGFTYNPGHAYVLTVRKEPVVNAPADASSFRWTLIKQESRKPVGELIDLKGTNWQLIAMRTAQQESLAPVPPTAGVSLQFQDKTISGSAGCNQVSGSYLADTNRLRIAVSGDTLTTCPPWQTAVEQDYLATLPKTVTHWVVAGNLHLLNAAGNTILIFAPARGPEQPQSRSTTPAGATTTLFIGPTVAACAGVAPRLCLQVKENPDAAYQNFDGTIEGFTYTPGYSYWVTVAKEPVANTPADASSMRWTLIEEQSRIPVGESMNLEGTNWQLIAMSNAQGELTPVPPAMGVTLQFQDGRAFGSAGCNRFFGFYVAEGSSLSITTAGSTRMACPEPRMTLERAYLAALPTTAAFWIVEDNLHLVDSNNDTILIFVPVQP